MTRFVACSGPTGTAPPCSAPYRLGLIVTTVSSFVRCGAVLASPWLSETVYNKPDLVTPLRFVAFAIPPGVLTAVVASPACSGSRTMRRTR
jgi:hypothetical protein